MWQNGNGIEPGQPRRHQLTALRGLLGAALELVAEIADPLLERLVAAFRRLPEEDREVIVGIIEREAESRHMGDATASATGMALRPNPHARLYVRVIAPEPAVEQDKIIIASARAIRMLNKVIGPIQERWRVAMLETFRGLDPDERAAVVRFNRDMLAMIEEVEHELASAPSPADGPTA
jgi:hypothetical protein